MKPKKRRSFVLYKDLMKNILMKMTFTLNLKALKEIDHAEKKSPSACK